VGYLIVVFLLRRLFDLIATFDEALADLDDDHLFGEIQVPDSITSA
jgi:hypothetical protein